MKIVSEMWDNVNIKNFILADAFDGTINTTENYVASQAMDFRQLGKVLVTIYNMGSNALKYKIEGSATASDWQTLYADIVVNGNSSDYKAVVDAWAFIRVSVADNVLGNHTTAQIFVSGKI